MIRPFIKAIRPQQWVKNLFVGAPLLFSQRLTDSPLVLRGGLAFIAFCFVASGVYLLNDLSDRERDQKHPTKKNRPIASGALSLKAARWGIVGLWSLAGLLCLVLGWRFAVPVAAYLIINFFYSFYLRNVPIVDVGIIAFGFLLRVVSGGEAIGVPLSHWIILNTFLLAFFMGLGKRYQELNTHGADSGRAALAKYSPRLLKILLYLTAAATVVGYVAYTLSPQTLLEFGSAWVVLTSIFPAAGIIRFLQLCERKDASPTEAILRDPILGAIVGFWVIWVILLIL
jgi:decaprenyl-phosphate phosphoribosyltransferase